MSHFVRAQTLQPPYQPASPQEPAPKPGQPNYPNIERFNEQEPLDNESLELMIDEDTFEDYVASQIEIDKANGVIWCKPCQKGADPGTGMWRIPTRASDVIEHFRQYHKPERVDPYGGWTPLVQEQESEEEASQDAWCYLHDKEINPDPDIPEPVEPDSQDDGHEIHAKPQTMTAEGIALPDKIEIPERLYNDLMMMIEYSTSNDNESGGFLIKAKHGELGVVGEQFGKDREIVLEPNEQLHEGEELIGTVHTHPVTPTASTGDVTGYLNDENEKVMLVTGADKSINVFFKTDFTAEGDYGDEISDNFEQSDMGMLCEGLGFIWYRGEESDRTTLNLMTNIVEDIEFDVLEETWPIEDVVKALGIKGRPDIPEEYSQKKQPLKLQIPFSYCNERRLKG